MRSAMITMATGLAMAVAPLAYLARGTVRNDRSLLSPGAATPGHAQMADACGHCHVGAGGDVQQSCVDCHQAGLTAAEDTHSAALFDDPTRAGDRARLDVTRCATCHAEHRPHLTDTQSVTVAADFCVVCHGDVLVQTDSHRGMDPSGCAAAGCHRYHDNRSLYPELLRAHLDDAPLSDRPLLPVRTTIAPPVNQAMTAQRETLEAAPADGPPTADAVREWRMSAHARAAVGCAACHQPPELGWSWRPTTGVCDRCHEPQRAGHSMGKHGMRPAMNLSPLRTDDAHAPVKMKASAHGRELQCTSCHGAHAVVLQATSVEMCEGCHDDEHTRAFRDSKHARLWEREQRGEGAAGSGVSCASCHLPRVRDSRAADGRIVTDHNQNRNLRPRDKMARAVCGACHGLPFSLAALADDQCVRANFSGPARQVRTGVDLVREHKTKENRRIP